jgi:hypothetical protein
MHQVGILQGKERKGMQGSRLVLVWKARAVAWEGNMGMKACNLNGIGKGNGLSVLLAD